MKHWIVGSLVLPFLVAACGGGNGGFNAAGTIATVPAPAPTGTCTAGATNCPGNNYGQFTGYTPYPSQPSPYGMNGGANGVPVYGNFCDCPVGFRPVYNAQYGLGCVSMAALQPYASGTIYWGWNANNNQWVNIPQVSNTQGYPSSNACYRHVAQSCFVDQANTCGANATCQPTGGGSRLGVCVH